MTQYGSSWTEAVQGGIEYGGAMVTPFLRPKRLRWGATDDEFGGSYPGDELVPHPRWTATHAITIEATSKQVWPWIAQIGQGRGGFYSYQRLENLAGSKIENVSRVRPEHQAISVGDPIKLHADTPPMTAAVVEEPHALVLYGDPAEADDGATLSTTWAFLLLERPDGTTRLLSRTRYDHADDRRSKLMGGPWLLEPVSFVMERKMLKVIKELVESPLHF